MSAALSSITGRIGKLVMASDLALLDSFIGSEQFIALLAQVPATKRPTALVAYNTARKKCLEATPVAAAGSRKADWKKPGAIERFKRLWLKHGGNKIRIAHEMRITVGAVKVAHSRFIRHGATATYTVAKNASRKPQDCRDASRHPMAAHLESDRVRAQAAAA